MSEETVDEFARERIQELTDALEEVLQALRIVKDWNHDLSERIKALETARHNQPPN